MDNNVIHVDNTVIHLDNIVIHLDNWVIHWTTGLTHSSYIWTTVHSYIIHLDNVVIHGADNSASDAGKQPGALPAPDTSEPSGRGNHASSSDDEEGSGSGFPSGFPSGFGAGGASFGTDLTIAGW